MSHVLAALARTFGVLALLLVPGTAQADEPGPRRERFAPAQQFRVQSRMKGTATLPVPPGQDTKTSESLTKTAESDIDYGERVIDLGSDGLPTRLLRFYEKIDYRKEIDKHRVENTLRDPVRRVVLVQERGLKNAFSPDGPLLIGELELVRKDHYTPALNGLLPERDVRPGDSWQATEDAIRELTDMQRESGEITCKYAGNEMAVGRKVARINISGSVRGVSEDGPVRHAFTGHILFDLQSRHLCYLSLLGKQEFLDKDGKSAGSFDGSLTITRQAGVQSARLGDDASRGLTLTPDSENSRLLYDNEDLGIRFTYPRRWKVSGVQNRQVMIDADEQNGILLTPLPSKDVPTPQQFGREVEQFLRGQGGRPLSTQGPRRVQSNPDVDSFTIEAEMNNQRVVLDYYVARMRAGGATLAARLLPQAARELRPEVERIARSVVVTK